MLKLTYWVVSVVALLAACQAPSSAPTSGAGSTGAAPSSATTSASASASAKPPSTRVQASPTGLGSPVPTISGTPAPGSFNEFCGNPQAWRDVPLAVGGSTLAAAEAGSGPNVAVFLHQTTDTGMCGWARKGAATMVQDAGIRAILLDFCGHGRSRCTPELEADWTAQVRAAVDHARATGASRVTLVGSSLGGSVAVRTAAAVGADALVDVSGPATLGTRTVADDAPGITMPALFVFSPDDAASLAAVKAALPSMPTTRKEVHEVSQGHGYAIVGRDQATVNKIMALVLGR